MISVAATPDNTIPDAPSVDDGIASATENSVPTESTKFSGNLKIAYQP